MIVTNDQCLFPEENAMGDRARQRHRLDDRPFEERRPPRPEPDGPALMPCGLHVGRALHVVPAGHLHDALDDPTVGLVAKAAIRQELERRDVETRHDDRGG